VKGVCRVEHVIRREGTVFWDEDTRAYTMQWHGDLWHQKTRVPELSCGFVCAILCLTVLVELRLGTDRHTDRGLQHIPRGKNVSPSHVTHAVTLCDIITCMLVVVVTISYTFFTKLCTSIHSTSSLISYLVAFSADTEVAWVHHDLWQLILVTRIMSRGEVFADEAQFFCPCLRFTTKLEFNHRVRTQRRSAFYTV